MKSNPLYTDKQNEILSKVLNQDWYMLILHGAVRAGKTKLNNDLFLMELLRAKKNASVDGVETPMYILAAYSSGTLHTNILNELTNEYGIEFKFDRHNNFTLFGVKVITTFTRSIAGLGAIRGMTAYGAYINEASLANKEVFDEVNKRLSGRGARIITDTNPDHPKHWLKTDYIDKADGERILQYNFTIFDNCFLSERYVQNIIQTTPSGAMTDRGIYGLWTAGDGAVYQDYNEEKHVITQEQLDTIPIVEYLVGVDWGYEHYGSMLVIGHTGEGEYVVIEEHAKQHLHFDDWLEIALSIQAGYGKNVPFYCDSARPEYVDGLFLAGLNAMNANKKIIQGITEVGSKFKSDKLYIMNTCYKLLDELPQYVWNDRGEKPVDVNDDSVDALRYGIYTHEQLKIERGRTFG